MTIHLRAVERKAGVPAADGYPFTVPAVRALESLHFTHEVTCFVGENGSGKSTVLEALALLTRLPAIGSQESEHDPSLSRPRLLADRLRPVWNKATRRGFFMRSEDFFGYATRIAQMSEALEADRRLAEAETRGRSAQARALAQLPYRQELAALRREYGDGLDAQSHGESYFKLFRARFVPHGLYLLDEPEAPLSPARQLALIVMLHDMVGQGAQFIIATHSPILLAYPGAQLYDFSSGQITPASYDTLEHVRIARDFLASPERYLAHLLG